MVTTILLYAMIFTLKIIEVSIATTRIILITKGEKKIGSFISFFEICLWLFLVSTVLSDVREDPIKLLVYALGFAVGQYVGSVIEDKVAIGTVRVEAIVLREHSDDLTHYLRDKGFAVTTISAYGKDFPRSILVFYVARKEVKFLTKEIKEHQENVVLTADDVRPIYGGYRKTGISHQKWIRKKK